MRFTNKVTVTYHNRTVGTLSMTPDNRLCAFQYDKDWSVNGFSISPLDLPLKSDLFIAKPEPFWGNFGIFEDSLPDGYGRYLLNRMLKKQGINDSELTPLQRLSIVGTSGMGALCYIPETYIGEEKTLPELDDLQQMALDVLSERSDKGEDILYFNSGNSGGCRPKCLYHDAEGAWLVKFRYLTQDPKQVAEMFRRMVFNVLTDNKDDHAKNFSFICREGTWSLAPAYDLTRCSNGYNGEHVTSVNNNGNPTIEDMLVVGESIRIPRKKGTDIIMSIAEECSEILSTEYKRII